MPEYFDMHCHILFGVDDGPERMEDALALLQLEYDSGVRTIYLTPHYRRSMFECPPDVRMRNYELLKEWAGQHLPDLTLNLGCELYVNMDVVQELKDGECFTLGNTDFVLLEFPVTAEKSYLVERCHAVMNSGYTPVIAHAERCASVRKDLELLQRLVDMGVYIQMNAGSIIGENGLAWKWFCKKAMRRGLLHFVGSDTHDLKKHRPNLEKCARYLEKVMGADYRDQIMIRNPRELIEGSV
ncbi:MAG: capsular biosynthesis protein [Oscillospiraceae bacterium]|nr:capsular biosynthesis protein [Oscillospiraceae bacterium]